MVDLNDGRAEEREFEGPFEDEFERELRANLRPRSAPEGFAERTLRSRQLLEVGGQDFRRSKLPRGHARLRFPATRSWLGWSAAACLLLTFVAGGLLQREHERREAGQRARQQVLLALRITGATLQDVRSKVEDPHSTGVYEPEQ